MDLNEKYKAARTKALSCAGWKIGDLRERLRYSYYTLHRNWQELEGWFEWAAGNQGKTAAAFSFFDSDRKFRYLRELEKLLHNYCAAVMTLVDHTRRIHNDIKEYKDVSKEFDALVKTWFQNDGLSQFVQKLRQYLLHYDPISSDYSLQWRAGELSVPFKFRKGFLLQYNGWNKYARKFILESGDELDIRSILTKYSHRVKEFYDLLYDKHEEWFAEEIKEMNALFAEAIATEEKLNKSNKSVADNSE